MLEGEVIMNWNILKKCVLMLFLGAAVHLTWIIWKSFVLLTPSVWQWVNVPIVQLQLTLNSIFFILLLLLIWPRIGKPLLGLLLLATAAISYFMNQYGVLIDQIGRAHV